MDAAAEEEEVVGGVEDFCQVEALVVYGAEDVFEFAGEPGELVDEVEGFGVGDGALDLGKVQGPRTKRRWGWAVKALVEATPILGTGVGGDGALGAAGDGCADDVADGGGLGAFGDESTWAARVSARFRRTSAGDEEADGAWVGDGVAVTVLGGVVDLDGEAGEALDHEFAGEACVP